MIKAKITKIKIKVDWECGDCGNKVEGSIIQLSELEIPYPYYEEDIDVDRFCGCGVVNTLSIKLGE